ncbi:hypothetical protein [Poseidonocella sp. HB161398]|uniref:hypothetical protein n=1 Tax=Poseidonocella sp. HB161398 TaxID=2320855 RepID=UPI001108CBEF|nr:hypothetical protein [Poseidonocella sp. HB161398]
MFVIADTERLVADGVLTAPQAAELESRARASMVELAAGLLLSFGILAAAGGVIFWLRDAIAVALCGSAAVAAGLALRAWAPRLLQLFGTAALLTGAGMLLGGSAAELLWNHPALAGPVMVPAGALVLIACGLLIGKRPGEGFALSAILLMGLAMHLGGLYRLLTPLDPQAPWHGAVAAGFWAYAALLLAAAGRITDLRWVTVLAILPFAQILSLGLGTGGGQYLLFMLDDPTIALLQMAALAGLCLLLLPRLGRTGARHAAVLLLAALILANLCAFAGSMAGDTVGSTWFAPRYADFSAPPLSADATAAERAQWQEALRAAGDRYDAALAAWKDRALTISEGAYSLVWALALAGLMLWSAMGLHRGVFNASAAFAVLHAYAQIFLRFDGQPLAFVIAGLAAIPLAWGARQANRWLAGRAALPQADGPGLPPGANGG